MNSRSQNAPANFVYAGKYVIGTHKYSTQGGHVYDAFNVRTRMNVNMKFGHLLEPGSHEKEWRNLCALEKFRHDPQNESIADSLVKEVVYDVICSKLYQGIVFTHTAVNLERLLAISKVEGSGKLPMDFATRVFIQMLEGCAFLNRTLESIHGLIEPSSIDFCNHSVVPSPEGGRLPATPRIVLTDLFNVQKFGFRDKDMTAYSMNYKSPEAAMGLKLAKASDVWACGCVLYEMIFGHSLFDASTHLELLNTIEKAIGPIPQKMLRSHLDFYGARNLRVKENRHLGLKEIYDVSEVRPLETRFKPEERGTSRLLRKALQLDTFSRPEPASMLMMTEDERMRAKRRLALQSAMSKFPDLE